MRREWRVHAGATRYKSEQTQNTPPRPSRRVPGLENLARTQSIVFHRLFIVLLHCYIGPHEPTRSRRDCPPPPRAVTANALLPRLSSLISPTTEHSSPTHASKQQGDSAANASVSLGTPPPPPAAAARTQTARAHAPQNSMSECENDQCGRCEGSPVYGGTSAERGERTHTSSRHNTLGNTQRAHLFKCGAHAFALLAHRSPTGAKKGLPKEARAPSEALSTIKCNSLSRIAEQNTQLERQMRLSARAPGACRAAGAMPSCLLSPIGCAFLLARARLRCLCAKKRRDGCGVPPRSLTHPRRLPSLPPQQRRAPAIEPPWRLVQAGLRRPARRCAFLHARVRCGAGVLCGGRHLWHSLISKNATTQTPKGALLPGRQRLATCRIAPPAREVCVCVWECCF